MLHFRTFASLLVLCVTALVGCAPAPPGDKGTNAAQRDLAELKAETVKVRRHAWPLIVRVHGSMVADEVAVVGTQVAGRVGVVHVDLGDVVHERDQLVSLDQEEFKLQVAQMEAQLKQACAAVGLKMGDDVAKLNPENAPPVRQAKALWDEAKANLARARQLLSQDATSESEFERVATAERVAESQYASAMNSVNEKIAEISVRSAELSLAQQRLVDAVVRAPFDGLIEQRHVAPGSFVQVGQAIATVVRTDRLRFRATMPERRAQQLAVGQEVRLHIESTPTLPPVKVTRISPAVDELSRALMFEAIVDNGNRGLRTGLFAEADVVLDPEAQSVVVPLSSVMEFAGVDKVWKVVNGVTEEKVVMTGQRRENSVEIIEGLAVGELILLHAKEGRPGRIEGEVDGKPESSAIMPGSSPAEAHDEKDRPTTSPVATE